MTVDFATPIAHQTNGNYSAFNNAIAIGRPFRQPLQTAADPGNFTSGIELFLSSAGDVAMLYSWLDCIVGWQPASTTQPGDRLLLTTQPHVLKAPGAARTLSSLKVLERHPKQAIYENVDRMSVQSALEAILTNAYNSATGNPASWHPSMRMLIQEASGTRTLKEHLDNNPQAPTRITELVNDFLTGGTGAIVTQIPVKAGESIGRAAGYLASDPLPPSPPFPLGNPEDANRARRLTFSIIDQGNQFLNPLYYLNIYMRQMLEPASRRIVRSLTNIVDSGILRHPLVSLFPAIAAANPPPAREQVSGQYRFPIGELHNWHGFPDGTPVSRLEWRYNDVTIFEAQARVHLTPVPRLTPNANETTKVANLWNSAGPNFGGAAIGIICEELQVPCELVIALTGTESLPNLDPRATRMEPFKDTNRIQLRANGISAAYELAYDQMVGRRASVTAVTANANNTSRLDITLASATSWAANVLRRRKVRLLVGNTDRLSITANTSGNQATNYKITVEDRPMLGGQVSSGAQSAGTTRFYSPVAEHKTLAEAEYTLPHSGTLQQLQGQATSNRLTGNTTVTLLRNGVATSLSVILPKGRTSGSDNVNTVAVAAGDTIGIRVDTGGKQGRSIRNLGIQLQLVPSDGTPVVIMKGGFASGGSQLAGDILYYSPLAEHIAITDAQFTAGRGGTLQRMRVHADSNTLDGNATITIFSNGTATALAVTLAPGTTTGNDNTNIVSTAPNDALSIQVQSGGTTGSLNGLSVQLYHAPVLGDVYFLEGHSASVPQPWNGAALVRPGRTLTWDQLQEIVTVTNGERISPGLLQTLISTAQGIVPFINAVAPNLYTRLGIPAPPANAGGYLNDWLLTGSHSILLGAAYIRKGYNVNETAYDLPRVGGAYNAGRPLKSPGPWGLVFHGDYVERAGPHFNAAIALFDGTPPASPQPTVRFMW